MAANNILFPSKDLFFYYGRDTATHGGLLHRIVRWRWLQEQSKNFLESAAKMGEQEGVSRRRSKRKAMRSGLASKGVKLSGDGRSVTALLFTETFLPTSL